MGQKVNPNILRVGKFTNWDYTYHEKKLPELKQYTFQNLNMKNFIIKFFKDNGLIINKIKINFNANTINIYVSYYLSFDYAFYKNIKVKLLPKKKPKYLKSFNLTKKVNKKRFKYQQLKVRKENNKTLKSFILTKTKKIIHQNLNKSKIRRMKILKFQSYKNLIKDKKNFSQITLNNFSEQLLNNLNLFNLKNKKIFLTLEHLNKNVERNTIKMNKIKSLQTILIRLRRYNQSKFFKEGVNVMFLSGYSADSALLLSQFIANNLKKQKRHNFFLRFIKAGLVLFTTPTFSNLKGIKIKIKGRVNGRRRARRRIIKIRNGISTLTLNSKINYSESTAFTPNGTLGVKVWLEKRQSGRCLTDLKIQNIKKQEKVNSVN